ncbi:MAG: BON domain-containing protein [Desulfobacterales bacterium]
MKAKNLVIFLVVAVLMTFSASGLHAQKENDAGAEAKKSESEKSASKETEKSDEAGKAWIKTKLTTTYTLNEHLNPFEIDVTVKDGTVTLSGVVENDIQKELAEEIAWGVEGVQKVENNISVEPETEGRGEEQDFFGVVNDASTTARVKYRLLWNRHTDGLDIEVNTKNGVVTLAGLTATEIEKELAVKIAENTKGVSDVVDQLKVSEKEAAEEQKSVLEKTGRFMSDAWITSKVHTTLLFSKEAEGSDVEVDTQDGVVTLEGSAKSEKQKQQIIELAEDVTHVKSVQSKLTVEK